MAVTRLATNSRVAHETIRKIHASIPQKRPRRPRTAPPPPPTTVDKGVGPSHRVAKRPIKPLHRGQSKGMANPGNWCYRNAILQCLLHQNAYCDMLDKIHNNCNAANKLKCTTCVLKSMRRRYWDDARLQGELNRSGKRLDKALRANTDPEDDIYIGRDVHEGRQSCPYDFLKFLIHEMNGGPMNTNNDTPLIDQTFTIQLQKHFTCRFCGTTRDLNDSESRPGLEVGIDQPYKELPLTSYLRLSCFQDQVGLSCTCEGAIQGKVGDQWPAQCQRSRILNRPDIVVVRLNRFTIEVDEGGMPVLYDEMDSYGETNTVVKPIKYRDRVPVEEWLNLGKYTEDEEDLLYRLDGVVWHEGGSTQGGHYVAALRGTDPNDFYAYNDASKQVVHDVPERNTVELLKTLDLMGEFWEDFDAFV